MRRFAWLAIVASFACAALPFGGTTVHAASDPSAIAIANRVMAALGGADAWNSLPALEWTWQYVSNDSVKSERRHLWDKRSGWQRVEGVGRDGRPYVFTAQIDGPAEHAWIGGVAIQGDSLEKLGQRSRALWRNDSYWFLMPYKLLDPGCRLANAGDTTVAKTRYHRLALSFERVGDTPGDRYWVWVNAANARVERWDFLLQGDTRMGSWSWEDWQLQGGLMFAGVRRSERNQIRTVEVHPVSRVSPTAFTAP
ncbi:MAG: hypothetical protein HOP12_13915 [Candidatus Eisenbacteria bacterium]|uniref:DUF3047 domain-containing protein n=1 Tax=Eiseniibacteriota bacterium TaxID=2212470 RepID=A0A849SHM7_UNCEI|nr:hypothetical protein [Candidatus Eisenbacteria bacterium]